MKVVDLFAGWGGFTEGAEMAGADVVFAANHWPLAVEAHAKNHPFVEHACQDLRQMDWSTLPKFDLLLAAPACQGHSQAAQPQRAAAEAAGQKVRRKHDELRGTAFSVLDCAEVCRPKAIVVENVPDFLRWDRYPNWRRWLEDLGYLVQEHVLLASDFGVPQLRRRVFITCTLNHKRVEITPTTPGERHGIDHIIDWDSGRWRPIESRSGNALRRLRLAQSIGPRAWVQHVTHHKGLPVSEPFRTITTGDQIAVVKGDMYRPLTVRETARGMGFGDHYAWPKKAKRKDCIKGLGNAVCPPQGAQIVKCVMEAA